MLPNVLSDSNNSIFAIPALLLGIALLLLLLPAALVLYVAEGISFALVWACGMFGYDTTQEQVYPFSIFLALLLFTPILYWCNTYYRKRQAELKRQKEEAEERRREEFWKQYYEVKVELEEALKKKGITI